ncbi:MAG: hypothetical protein IK138_03215 [Lachnospiraceae bacterium]|nr:hypothetical protein [Lachnospiraceae bacterium]
MPYFVKEKEMEAEKMVNNIIIVVFSLIALAGGIFGWWLDHGGTSEDTKKDESKKEGKSKDEKN